MALEHLLAAIEQEAAQEIARIEAESRRTAEQVLAQAKAQAQEIEAAEWAAAEARLRSDAARLIVQARIAATRHVMHVREAIYQRAAEEAQAELAAVRSRPDYPAVLAALLAEAMAALPAAAGFGHGSSAGLVIYCDPRDAGLVQALAANQAASVVPSLTTWGGVDVATTDHRIVARNTLEARLARAEPHLRRLVAQALFVAAEPHG